MSLTRFSRLTRRITAALALSGAAVVGLPLASADAYVNTSTAPYARIPWGDCTGYLGSVAQSDYAAVGGVDVYCNSVRTSITARVFLWRWNGSSWSNVATSAWKTDYGQRSLVGTQTPRYPYCGYTWWDETATVNVDGYQTNWDYGKAVGSYAKYDPCDPTRHG